MNGRRNWAQALTAAWLLAAGAGWGAEPIVIDGSTTVGPLAKAFAEYYQARHADVAVTVSESGSGNGAKSLINGTCTIAAMSRAMKENELQAARDKGLHPVAHVVCMDGIALVVHPANPVGALTTGQIREIYAGRITNWKALGGPDRPIVAISRDTNSGTYETFEERVMQKTAMGSGMEYVGSNGAVRQRVLTTPAAIGYVGLAFLEGVKAVTVNGVACTEETVGAGRYPISRPLYFYTKPDPAGHVAAFLNLSRSDEGRRIVEEMGFVPAR